jgi:hypothetical protein
MMHCLFVRLYQSGPPEKFEKLRCILHYFQRIAQRSKFLFTSLFFLFENVNLVPGGVLTFRRSVLLTKNIPKWSISTADLCDIHISVDRKIEDVDYALQVNRNSCIACFRTILS